MTLHSAPVRSMSQARRILCAGLACLFCATQAAAVGLLRDAETEYALTQVAKPVLTAAGLSPRRTRILVVNDLKMNAFVVDSQAVFVTAGLLLRMSSPEQLQAVIAHEAAHIANGHFARRSLNAQSARTGAMIGAALGIAAGVAAGSPAAGVGLALGSQTTAQRTFLAHTREEESAADKSGLRYLARAGIPPTAMASVLELFAGQEALTPGRQDPYARTHPLTRARIRALELTASSLTPRAREDAEMERYWFERAQAKLSAYLRAPAYTFNRLSPGDDSDAALVARAVAHHRNADLAAARRPIATLIARRPEDAFAHALSGWIELEAGKVDPAIAAYAAATRLAPDNPLLLADYGRALLARNTPQADAEAREALMAARARDPQSPRMLRDLALAHARSGENGLASLATAERYALLDQLDDAEIHARRAADQLPTGSPGWSRAQDVIRAAERAQRR